MWAANEEIIRGFFDGHGAPSRRCEIRSVILSNQLCTSASHSPMRRSADLSLKPCEE